MADNKLLSEASKTASALVISAAHKAGMDHVDRARIDEIILRESKSSAFMQQQQRRDEQVNRRIHDMKKRYRDILEQDAPRRKRNIGINEEEEEEDVAWTEEKWRAKRNVALQSRVNAICRRQKALEKEAYNVMVVVDMDAFFVNCELLQRPDLADKPTCVGGPSMISTANYVARQYGVRSAMPGFIGAKLVHELSQGRQRLHFLKSSFGLYKAKSQQVQAVLREYDPWTLQSYSLDEVLLQLGPYLRLKARNPTWTHAQLSAALSAQNPAAAAEQQPPRAASASDNDVGMGQDETSSLHSSVETNNNSSNNNNNKTNDAHHTTTITTTNIEMVESVVHQMRQQVRRATGGLTCSAGMGPNFRVAKMASERHKPNGQYWVHDTWQFLRPLAIRKVPGIGRVTEKLLRDVLEITTVEQLYHKRADIDALFRPATANFLLHASLGSSAAREGSANEEQEEDDHHCDNHASSSTPTITSSFGWAQRRPRRETANAVSSSSALSCPQKGISCERTFPSGQAWSQVMDKLEDVCHSLSQHMKQKNLRARHLTLKVKLSSFVVITRSMSFEFHVQQASELLDLAAPLLRRVKREYQQQQQQKQQDAAPFSIRLLGVRCTKFQTTDTALNPTRATTNSSTKPQVSIGKCWKPSTPTSRCTDPKEGRTCKSPLAQKVNDDENDDDEDNNEEEKEKENSQSTATATMMRSSPTDEVPMDVTPHANVGVVPTNRRLFHQGRTMASPKETLATTTTTTTTTKCPICHANLGQQVNNITLNRHVDECLHRAGSSSSASSSLSLQKRSLSLLFSSSSSSSSSSPATSSKARRLTQKNPTRRTMRIEEDSRSIRDYFSATRS